MMTMKVVSLTAKVMMDAPKDQALSSELDPRITCNAVTLTQFRKPQRRQKHPAK
jgi:hypothetical protein